MTADSASLPLYFAGVNTATGSSRELSMFMDANADRLSFPATVRDSVASSITVRPRSTPPVVPLKPPSLSSARSVSPTGTIASSVDVTRQLAQSDDDLDEEAGQKGEADDPAQWLDIMLRRSESGAFEGAAPSRSGSTRTLSANPNGTSRATTAPPLPARPPAAATTQDIPPAIPPRPISASASGSHSAPPLSPRVSPTLTSASPPSSTLHSISARLQQTNQHYKIRDRLVGAVGAGREWGGKRLQDGWKHLGATSTSSFTPSHSSNASTSSDIGGGARDRSASPLPSSVFGHKLPRPGRPMAFGQSLPAAVSTTRVEVAAVSSKRSSNSFPSGDSDDSDPVTGASSRRWLPSVAYRCLQYLDTWSATEVGIYRVGGGSQLVAQIRALFDSGLDVDLRDIPPQHLDPHAVASCFKQWLRELPESSILSPRLEARIDAMTMEAIGHSASGSQILGVGPAAGTPNLNASPPLGNGTRAPRAFLEALQRCFAQDMEAEYFHLLRALAHHLARVASHAETNKMTLSNLRLILSPTLRISPTFLQILVDERDMLFAGPNDSAGRREYDTSRRPSLEPPKSVHSRPSSPSLASTSASNSATPRAPQAFTATTPREIQTPTQASVDLPPSPAPSESPPMAREPFRTPIADKFVAFSSSSYPLYASSSTSVSTSTSTSSASSPVMSSVSVAPTSLSSTTSLAQSLSVPTPNGKPAPGPKPAFLPSRGNSLGSDTAGRRSWFANRGDLPAPRSPVMGTSAGGGAAATTSHENGSATSSSPHSSSTSPALGSVREHTTAPSTSPALPPNRPYVNSSRRTGSGSSFASLISASSSSGSGGGGGGGGGDGSRSSSRRRGHLRRMTSSSSLLNGLFGSGATTAAAAAEGEQQERLASDIDVGGGGERRPTRPGHGRSSSASSRAANRLSGFFGRASIESDAPVVVEEPPARKPVELPTLPMLSGVGVGLGLGMDGDAAASSEDGGFSLLSMEERRRLFGG